MTPRPYDTIHSEFRAAMRAGDRARRETLRAEMIAHPERAARLATTDPARRAATVRRLAAELFRSAR